MSSPRRHVIHKIILTLQHTERSAHERELLLNFLLGLPDLNKYLVSIPRDTLLHMCGVVKAENFSAGTVIFNKGDYSDKFYVIISGKIEIFNTNREGEITFRTYLGNGKKLGEQGLISRQPRSLSAVAAEPTLMLVMNNSQFKQYLREGFLVELTVQLAYIERYLPSIEHYSRIQRIMIAYCLKTESYRRGNVILPQGVLSENLYIVVEGEAEIIAELSTGSKSILKLSAGSIFGEEGVFLAEKTKYSIACASERLNLFFMRKFDAVKVLPEEIVTSLIQAYKAKIRNRRLLAESKVRSEINLKMPERKDTQSNFMWASPLAKKKLENIQLCRTRSSCSLPTQDESFLRRKSILKKLSDNTQPTVAKAIHLRRREAFTLRNTLSPRSPRGLPLISTPLSTRSRYTPL